MSRLFFFSLKGNYIAGDHSLSNIMAYELNIGILATEDNPFISKYLSSLLKF